MSNIIKVEELPEHIKKEVLHYAEYLLNKYNREKKERAWLKNLRRGNSKGEMASETIVKMRSEEKW